MAKKRTDTAVDLNIPYEQNLIQLRGIFGFGIGLFLLIVVTFALMWALLNVLQDYSRENAPPANPMTLSDKERLPPEPRLQAAPGFAVDGPAGRVNLELTAPQAEYRELKKQWEELWANGQKNKQTGTVTVMSIKDAKEKFLSSSPKSRSGTEAEKVAGESMTYFSDASAGRVASERRR